MSKWEQEFEGEAKPADLINARTGAILTARYMCPYCKAVTRDEVIRKKSCYCWNCQKAFKFKR